MNEPSNQTGRSSCTAENWIPAWSIPIHCILEGFTARTLIKRLSGAAILLTSLALCGCGKSNAVPNRKLTKAELELRAKKEIPGEISGTGWHIRWLNPAATGKRGLQTVVLADSAHGAISDPANPTISLYDVAAKIFRDGAQTGTVYAPLVAANQHDKVLLATGGVKLTSITDPPDTVVTGDAMRWDTTRNRLIVTGNARAVVLRPGRKPDTTTGDTLVFDTKLKELRNE